MNAKGTSALGSLSFSKSNKYVAYSVSEAGSDWQDIFVMEVKTKKIIDADRIGYTKFGGATWKGDEGFYYSGYDKPKNEAEKFSAKTEFQKIFFHKLGTSQNADKLIYEDKTNPLIYKGVGLTEDERFLILSLSQGTDGSEICVSESATFDKSAYQPLKNSGSNDGNDDGNNGGSGGDSG